MGHDAIDRLVEGHVWREEHAAHKHGCPQQQQQIVHRHKENGEEMRNAVDEMHVDGHPGDEGLKCAADCYQLLPCEVRVSVLRCVVVKPLAGL